MLIEQGTTRTTSYNKRLNVTYVYNVTNYLDDSTGKHIYKRHLIGKLDPDTGKMVQTRHKKTANNALPDVDYQVLYTETEKKRQLAEASAQQAKMEISEVKDCVSNIIDQLSRLSEKLANYQI